MAETNFDKLIERTKRSYRHNEYKHHAILDPDKPDEIAAKTTYQFAEKSTRFKDPYIEYGFSSNSPNQKNEVINDIMHASTGADKPDKNVSNSENTDKTRYDDKFYSKIYRNPILNRREKMSSRNAERPVDKVKESDLVSSYTDSYNDVKPPDSNISNSYGVNNRFNPIFKSPVIRKPDESFCEMKSRKFYTSTYNKCYENNETIGKNPSSEMIDNANSSKSKLRSLNGNLMDNVIKGRYNTRNGGANQSSNLKHNMDSIIYPFKN